MKKCQRPGHDYFKNNTCVECRRRRQREYLADCRDARNQLRELKKVLASV